ncbi:MAG: PAC2 family protein [Thermoproteota archaeon]
MVNTSIIPQNVDLKDLSLIAGFHGIGATGYVSIKYLIDQLKPEKVASVDTDAIFPVSSNSSGHLVTPYQIYKHNKLAILRAEISPSRKSELLFLRQLCDLLLDKKIKELILIGGLDSAFKADDSMVRYVHTSSFTPNQNFDNLKLLEDDRIIVGPVALMLNYMEMKKFPTYALLPFASAERVDYNAAAEALKIVSHEKSLDLDFDPLLSEDKKEFPIEEKEDEHTTNKGNENIYT